MVLGTKVSGKKTSNMVMEKRPGLMVPVMKANTLKEENMDRESFNGLMEAPTTGNSLTIIFKERVSTNGQMAEYILETGKTIRWMGREYLLGLTIESMKDSM